MQLRIVSYIFVIQLTKMEKAMIISRCSTSDLRQDVSRQTNELEAKYCTQFEIVKNFEYYKSGRSNDEQLSIILEYAIQNKVEHLLFSEVSRIARRVVETLIFIRSCTSNKINVVIDNYSMHTLNPDKSENCMTTTMLQIGAAFSEVEVRQTFQRLQSGRANFVAGGGKLGRKLHSKESHLSILEKHKDVVKCLKKGHSVRTTMKLTDKSNGTIQKVKQLLAA